MEVAKRTPLTSELGELAHAIEQLDNQTLSSSAKGSSVTSPTPSQGTLESGPLPEFTSSPIDAVSLGSGNATSSDNATAATSVAAAAEQCAEESSAQPHVVSLAQPPGLTPQLLGGDTSNKSEDVYASGRSWANRASTSGGGITGQYPELLQQEKGVFLSNDYNQAPPGSIVDGETFWAPAGEISCSTLVAGADRRGNGGGYSTEAVGGAVVTSAADYWMAQPQRQQRQQQPVGRSSAASTKAVLSALQSLQQKLKSLEAESVAAQDHADRLRTSIVEVETNAAAKLEATFAQARAQAAATAQQVDRLTGDKSELELELVRLAEAKQRVEAKVAASRTRTDDLELSRRASDAKATSHLDRAKRLHEEAEVTATQAAELAARNLEQLGAEAVVVAALEQRLLNAEAGAEQQRHASQQLHIKSNHSEEMLVSVLGIVDHLVHQKGSSKKISSNGSRNGRNSCGGTASPPRRRVQVKIPEPQFWLSAIHSVVASRRAASGTRPGATSANAMERAEWMAGDDDNIDDDDEGDPHYTIPTYASKVSCAANRKKAQQLQAKPKSKSGAKGCHYRHHSTAGMIGGKENNRAAYGGQADCHQHAEVPFLPTSSKPDASSHNLLALISNAQRRELNPHKEEGTWSSLSELISECDDPCD